MKHRIEGVLSTSVAGRRKAGLEKTKLLRKKKKAVNVSHSSREKKE